MRTCRLLSHLRHDRNHHSQLSCSFTQFGAPSRSSDSENPHLLQNKLINHRNTCLYDGFCARGQGFSPFRILFSADSSCRVFPLSNSSLPGSCRYLHQLPFTRGFITKPKKIQKIEVIDHGQRAVMTALCCNFLVISLKFGVWLSTSSHVILAEVVHSVADFANQVLLLLMAFRICGLLRIQNRGLFDWYYFFLRPPVHIEYAAFVIGGSFLIEGASLLVAIHAVRKGAAAEGMTMRDYVWRGHDPTAVAVMTEDGAAVTGLAIAAASLVAVRTTGNAIYDPVGSIIIGNLLGMVAIFLIQRNRHALIGRAIDNNDMKRVLYFLKKDPKLKSIMIQSTVSVACLPSELVIIM